jgi:hypothetical protein
LVSFTGKSDLLSILHTLVNTRDEIWSITNDGLVIISYEISRSNKRYLQDFKNLALRHDLFTVASVATVLLVDNLTLTTTFVARLLNLLYHRTHLTKTDLDTLTIAVSAGLNSAFFSSTAITLGAKDMLLECKLSSLAHIEIFEANLEAVGNIFATTGTRGLSAATTTTEHTTTEKLREQIFGIHTTTHATLTIQTIFTKLVIYATLLRVRKNFIGMRDFLELVTGFRVL